MNSVSGPVLNHRREMLVLQLLLFLVFLIATSVVEAGLFPQKKYVTIINGLQPATDITVHCKSKDDDLGVHVLPFDGKFSFSFGPNFWGSTLFFCGVEWKSSTLKYFDAYDEARDETKCEHCDWSIRADGPCLYNDATNDYDKCFRWNEI